MEGILKNSSEYRAGQKKRALQVGMTKDLVSKGYSASEIAEKLKLPESTVREYIHVIEEAERNKSQA